MTGGIGRPGGEGVIHSPTSVVTSATTPSAGARRTVFSRFTRAAASRLGLPIRARRCRARRRRRVAPALELVEPLDRDELLAGERLVARQLALELLGRPAGLDPGRPGRLDGTLLEIDLRPVVALGDPHEDVALADPGAFPDGELAHAPADLGRELRAAARFDRAGLAVGDALLDASPRRGTR
jgi:hypothetical protein